MNWAHTLGTEWKRPVIGLYARPCDMYDSLLPPRLTVVQHVTGYAFMEAVESHVSLKLETYAPQV